MLAQASAKTEAQQSYRVAITLKGDATAAKDAVGGQAGAVLSQPIDVSGEGTVQKPGSASLDLSLQLAGSPLQLLARGWSVTFRDGDPRTLRSVAGVEPGDALVTQLVDGRVWSRVERISSDA